MVLDTRTVADDDVAAVQVKVGKPMCAVRPNRIEERRHDRLRLVERDRPMEPVVQSALSRSFIRVLVGDGR